MGITGTDECRRLRERLEELEGERRDEADRRLEQAEKRRREREEAAKAELRTARDWPEAFRKQRTLIGPEMRMASGELAKVEADPAAEPADLAFWREDVASLRADLEGIDAAERIYAEEAAKAREEMEAVRRRMLAAVASRLRERGGSPSRGFLTDLIDRLDGDDDPKAWLNW